MSVAQNNYCSATSAGAEYGTQKKSQLRIWRKETHFGAPPQINYFKNEHSDYETLLQSTVINIRHYHRNSPLASSYPLFYRLRNASRSPISTAGI